jgi:chaperonin cofactor prefoldin
LRLSELRKDPGPLRNPNQLLQDDKFYLTVGEIFYSKSSRRCSKRVRDSQMEEDIKIYEPV